MAKQLQNIKTTVDSCIECPNFFFRMGFTGGIEFQCSAINDNSNGRLIPKDSDWNTFIHQDCPLKDAREQGVMVGISVFLLNNQNQILVGLRDNASSGNGCWGLPGGGMDAGESPITTAARETEEETGIVIVNPNRLEFANFTNDCFMGESGEHWITLYFLCRQDNFVGEAKRVEPHKCKEWRWVGLDEIQKPVFCDWSKKEHIDKVKKMLY